MLCFTKYQKLCKLSTDESNHISLLLKTGALMNDLLFNDLQKTPAESSVEFNLGLMKIKHRIISEQRSKEEHSEILKVFFLS
jgi:hypothetical protein